MTDSKDTKDTKAAEKPKARSNQARTEPEIPEEFQSGPPVPEENRTHDPRTKDDTIDVGDGVKRKVTEGRIDPPLPDDYDPLPAEPEPMQPPGDRDDK